MQALAGSTYQTIVDGSLAPARIAEAARALDERRMVTILFCDVTGSTEMAEQLDSEDWADVMREAFGELIAPVERYGGIVARLMGDAIMAFFGAPRAHEDDAQRAVLAALDILDGIQPLRRRMRSQHGLDFNVRIGINTGMVVVGEFGSAQASEYTAMGDAINLAARMEQTALPGAIQVAEATFKMTAPFFHFEPLGQIHVRGKSGTVQSYRALGRTGAPGRLWDNAGLNAPLAGRRAELDLLHGAFDELRAGRGQLISLIGEAGLGKTRLIEELRHAWQRYAAQPDTLDVLPVTWLENRLIAHEALQPYGALQQRLRQAFQVEKSDSPDALRAKIVQTLDHFPRDVQERATRVIELVLAVDGAGRRYSGAFDSAEARTELFELMLAVLRGWGNGGALIYVVEDTHLIDAASAELFVHILQLVREIPILFICSFRPIDGSAAWRIRDAARDTFADCYQELRLQPLDVDEAGELLNSLVVPQPDGSELRKLVLGKAEGNPLFIEELVRVLIERRVLGRAEGEPPRWEVTPQAQLDALEVPDSLQSLLLERLDRLGPDVRRVLQQASVLGRTFPAALLAAITEVNGRLPGYLEQLTQADLLAVEPNSKDREYSFRHALIWEVAYGATLKRQRRLYHLRAGEAIEQLYAERIDEHARTLGRHYFEAGDRRGVHWLLQAAERAQALHEPSAALGFVEDAEQLAAQVGEAPPAAGLRLRGHALETLGDYEGARTALAAAVDRSRGEADAEEEWQALIDLGMAWSERDYANAGALYQEALALAERLGDDLKLAHTLNRLGNWRANVGERGLAMAAHQQALAVFERLEDAQGRAQTLDYLGLVSYLAGDVRRSAEYNRSAAGLLRELGDLRGLSSTLAILAGSGGTLNSEAVPIDRDAAANWRVYAAEALADAREIGWRAGEAFALLTIALTAGVRGEFRMALEHAEQGRALAERIGHRQWLAGSLYTLGHLRLELLDYAGAEPLLRSANELAASIGSEYWTWSSASTLSALLRERGDPAAAEPELRCAANPVIKPRSLAERRCWLHRAWLYVATGQPDAALGIVADLQACTVLGAPSEDVPELAFVQAAALRLSGSLDAAQRELDAARAGAVALGYRPLERKLELEQARLATQAGDPAAAERAIARARAILDELADELDDAADRARFVSAAAAQAAEALGA